MAVGNLGRRKPAAEDTPAFGGIAEKFRRSGDLDKAIALCREGLKKFPDHVSARVTLGWALLDKGQYDEARAELEQALKRAPDNLAAIRGLAELHERAENTLMLPMDGPGQWPPDEAMIDDAVGAVSEVQESTPELIADTVSAALGEDREPYSGSFDVNILSRATIDIDPPLGPAAADDLPVADVVAQTTSASTSVPAAEAVDVAYNEMVELSPELRLEAAHEAFVEPAIAPTHADAVAELPALPESIDPNPVVGFDLDRLVSFTHTSAADPLDASLVTDVVSSLAPAIAVADPPIVADVDTVTEETEVGVYSSDLRPLSDSAERVAAELHAPIAAELNASVAAEADAPVVAEVDPAVVAEFHAAVAAELDPPVVAEVEAPVVAELDPLVVAEVDAPVVAELDPPLVAEVDAPVVASELDTASDPADLPISAEAVELPALESIDHPVAESVDHLIPDLAESLVVEAAEQPAPESVEQVHFQSVVSAEELEQGTLGPAAEIDLEIRRDSARDQIDHIAEQFLHAKDVDSAEQYAADLRLDPPVAAARDREAESRVIDFVLPTAAPSDFVAPELIDERPEPAAVVPFHDPHDAMASALAQGGTLPETTSDVHLAPAALQTEPDRGIDFFEVPSSAFGEPVQFPAHDVIIQPTAREELVVDAFDDHFAAPAAVSEMPDVAVREVVHAQASEEPIAEVHDVDLGWTPVAADFEPPTPAEAVEPLPATAMTVEHPEAVELAPLVSGADVEVMAIPISMTNTRASRLRRMLRRIEERRVEIAKESVA